MPIRPEMRAPESRRSVRNLQRPGADTMTPTDPFDAVRARLEALADWLDTGPSPPAALDLRAFLSRPDAQDRRWRPISEAPVDGTWIEVRQEPDLYRWLAYKPDGARQMKKAGRWQRCVWRGDYFKWENAELPETGWRIAEPSVALTQPTAGDGQ